MPIDPDVLRFERHIAFIVQEVKACASAWDTDRDWTKGPSTRNWHQWWCQVGESNLLETYMAAIPQWVRRKLGSGDLSVCPTSGRIHALACILTL